MNLNKIISELKTAVVYTQRRSLATYKVEATENAAKYLQQINLQKLLKDHKPLPSEDKKIFYEKLQNEAKQGPIFNSNVINYISNLPIDMDKAEIKWLANRILNHEAVLNRTVLQSILDWSRATRTLLDKQSVSEAQKLAAEWHEQFKAEQAAAGNYKTKDVVYSFPDGYTIVKITDPDDLTREGELMGHCVGGYCHQVEQGDSIILSLRDTKNLPHVTIELNKNNEVRQIQGKQNKEPILKYQKYVVDWLLVSDIDDEWIESIDYWEIFNDPHYKEIIQNSLYHLYRNIHSSNDKFNDNVKRIFESKNPKYIIKLLDNALSSSYLEENGYNINKLADIVIDSKNSNYIYSFTKLHRQYPDIDLKKLEKALIELKNPYYCRKFAEDFGGVYSDLDKLAKVVIDSGDINQIFLFLQNVDNVPVSVIKEVEPIVFSSGTPDIVKFFRISSFPKKKLLQKIFAFKDINPIINIGTNYYRYIEDYYDNYFIPKILKEFKGKDLGKFVSLVHLDPEVTKNFENEVLESKDNKEILAYCNEAADYHSRNSFNYTKFSEYFAKTKDADLIVSYVSCGNSSVPKSDVLEDAILETKNYPKILEFTEVATRFNRVKFSKAIAESKDPKIIYDYAGNYGNFLDKILQKGILETKDPYYIYLYAIELNKEDFAQKEYILNDEFRKALEETDKTGEYLKEFNNFRHFKKEASLRNLVNNLRNIVGRA